MKGCFFLPGVAAVDDVRRPSAVCAGDFGGEDGGG
jgi:hypothetical protein